MTAWKSSDDTGTGNWLKVSEKLRIRRDTLNSYVAALHEQHPNGWTVFKAMGVSVKGGDRSTPEFCWPETIRHDAERYSQLVKAVEELGLTRREVGAVQRPTFLNVQEWSAVWQESSLQKPTSSAGSPKISVWHFRNFATSLGIADVRDASNDELTMYGRCSRSDRHRGRRLWHHLP